MPKRRNKKTGTDRLFSGRRAIKSNASPCDEISRKKR